MIDMVHLAKGMLAGFCGGVILFGVAMAVVGFFEPPHYASGSRAWIADK